MLKSSVAYPCKVQERCLVFLFKKYIAKLPDTCMDGGFYLQSRSSKQIKSGKGWYKDRAVGENTLGTVVKRVTGDAELQGFYTNHSLRASCATTLYNDPCNLPEQVIAERTGHRSLAIRSYKHTKNSLKRKVSDILTDYSAGVSDEILDSKSTKDHEVIDITGENLVQKVKLDICVSVKK